MRGDRDAGEVQQGEGGGEGGGEGAAAAGYQGGCSVMFHNIVVIFYIFYITAIETGYKVTTC